MDTSFIITHMNIDPLILLAGAVTALAGAVIGNFLLIRKMTLISDSMPHITLPGIAIGVLLNINPRVGAMAFLKLAVAVSWTVRFKTTLELDSIIGVLFVTSLALGSVLAGGEADLLEAFFGSVEKIARTDALTVIALGLTVLGVTWQKRRSLLLSSIDSEVAESIGISPEKSELLFLTLVALTIAAGINFVGVLLMSSLLIVPSVTGRTLGGKSLKSFFMASSIIGVVSALGGLIISKTYDTGVEPGIIIVFISAGFFVLSLIWNSFRK